MNAGFDLFDGERDHVEQNGSIAEASDYIVDIREYDVPYHVRVAIDKGMKRAGGVVTTLIEVRYQDRQVVYRGGEARRHDSYVH